MNVIESVGVKLYVAVVFISNLALLSSQAVGEGQTFCNTEIHM